MKSLVVVVLLLLLATIAYCQGVTPPVLPFVTSIKSIQPTEELPSLKIISRDHHSVLVVKQTADGFTLSILKISPTVPKMK